MIMIIMIAIIIEVLPDSSVAYRGSNDKTHTHDNHNTISNNNNANNDDDTTTTTTNNNNNYYYSADYMHL